jgi:hypothetical protein
MTIQQLKRDLAGIREAYKPKMPNAVVLLYDRSGKVVRLNGLDVASLTKEEIDKKIKRFSVVLHLPVKDHIPG